MDKTYGQDIRTVFPIYPHVTSGGVDGGGVIKKKQNANIENTDKKHTVRKTNTQEKHRHVHNVGENTHKEPSET